MEKFNIGIFDLKSYDEHAELDQKLAKRFDCDNDFRQYVGDIWGLSASIKADRGKGYPASLYYAYIAGEIVGMIALTFPYQIPEFAIAILPKHRGFHYSRILYEEFAHYIFKCYQEYQSIYLHIARQNTHSIENAELAGFEHLEGQVYAKKRDT